ncbi:hypothetical protein BKA65DRAFT_510496 [Rhexocercosporidium sp. MPI-PUGE-AT-0058]|nr:hypothetical protein BKA65DRAFT_510496 [Rhexocercosporidium sp. MPI-PUGE-AT-0058]
MLASSNPTFRTFTCFPLLPTEIRLRIWQYTLQQPRLLPIRTSYDLETKVLIFHCSQLPPRLLSICRESRDEALHFYILVHGGGNSSFYFNSQTDTVSLRRPDVWLEIIKSLDQHIAEAATPGQDAQVRSLVIHHKYILDLFWPMSQLPARKWNCGVRELFFTVTDVAKRLGYFQVAPKREDGREITSKEVRFMPVVEEGVRKLKGHVVDAEKLRAMVVQNETWDCKGLALRRRWR